MSACQLSLHCRRAILYTREAIDFTLQSKNYTVIANSSQSEVVLNETVVKITNRTVSPSGNITNVLEIIVKKQAQITYTAWLEAQVDMFLPIYQTADIAREWQKNIALSAEKKSCVCLLTLHLQRMTGLVGDLLAELRNRALQLLSSGDFSSLASANAQEESCSAAISTWMILFIVFLFCDCFLFLLAIWHWGKLRNKAW